MPDDSGKFKGAFYRAEMWERVFGQEPTVQEAEEANRIPEWPSPLDEACDRADRGAETQRWMDAFYPNIPVTPEEDEAWPAS